MIRDLFSRYVWLVDTISRHDGITREEICRQWLRSPLSDGKEILERTFFNYRRAVESLFNIDIHCDSAGRYYIDRTRADSNKTLTNWMLDNYAVNSAISDTSAIAERISVEDVPSAREFLPVVLEAMRDNRLVTFTYAGFTRSRPESGIIFAPWLAKRYKQRWYMIGEKDRSGKVRTYALDRIKSLSITDEHFDMPSATHADLFGSIIGVTSSHAETRDVILRVSPQQAKYFRVLPLHESQREEIHDDFSIFTYRLKLNFELVQEILSYGPEVTVMSPHELRIMVTTQLSKTLANYGL